MADKFEKSLNMLSAALEMEEKGRDFYKKAIVTCKNKFGQDIFHMLMEDEITHTDRIQSIYKSLADDQCWSENWRKFKAKHDDIGAIFKSMVRKHGSDIVAETSDLEAIDVGIDMELRSIEFYKDHLAKATEPLEKEFMKEMISEERGHHLALEDTRFYLSNPSGWFREKERGGLDGA
jgi:rubrerythrin